MDSLHPQGNTPEIMVTPTNRTQHTAVPMSTVYPPPIYQNSQGQGPLPDEKQMGGEAPIQPIQNGVQQIPSVSQPNPAHVRQNTSNEKTYKSAVPLLNLGQGAAPADCPACGQRSMTMLNYETGNMTHVWAFILCGVSLCCLSYMINATKDVQHRCGRCGVLLATWKRSGHTVVHLFE